MHSLRISKIIDQIRWRCKKFSSCNWIGVLRLWVADLMCVVGKTSGGIFVGYINPFYFEFTITTFCCIFPNIASCEHLPIWILARFDEVRKNGHFFESREWKYFGGNAPMFRSGHHEIWRYTEYGGSNLDFMIHAMWENHVLIRIHRLKRD